MHHFLLKEQKRSLKNKLVSNEIDTNDDSIKPLKAAKVIYLGLPKPANTKNIYDNLSNMVDASHNAKANDNDNSNDILTVKKREIIGMTLSNLSFSNWREIMM